MGKDRDIKKAAEECCELATVLMQQLNKPQKDLTNRIIEELRDAMFRVENLKKHYNNDALTKRILFKVTKEEKKEAKLLDLP